MAVAEPVDVSSKRSADAKLALLAEAVGRTLLTQAQTLATAESCTGGWIA